MDPIKSEVGKLLLDQRIKHVVQVRHFSYQKKKKKENMVPINSDSQYKLTAEQFASYIIKKYIIALNISSLPMLINLYNKPTVNPHMSSDIEGIYVCVCVCVCVWEREIEKKYMGNLRLGRKVNGT